MHSTKIKICGITNLEDASAAVEMGADFLGFNFYPKSPRYIEPKKAFEIISKLPTFVDMVGIFVNSPVEEVREIAGMCELNWVQLHGDESPGFCNSLNSIHAKVIKAVRVRDENDIEYARNFSVDALLLDAYQPDRYGGTGKRLNWDLLPRAAV